MPVKKYIGRCITLKFKDKKQLLTGLLVDYNDDWTLLKHNPWDYVIDGYVIFRNSDTVAFRHGEEEKFREKIFKLKGITVTDADKMPLDNLETILQYLTEKYGLFSIEQLSDKMIYIGKLVSFKGKKYTLKMLSTRAKWWGTSRFNTTPLRIIGFDTDYINSLKLVLK